MPDGEIPDELDSAGQAFRCSIAARERGDLLAGTAAPALGYLLIEHAGPWGRNALVDSLPAGVGRAIVRRAREAGVRPLLVRRPGRRTPSSPPRFGFFDARPRQEGLGWRSFTDYAEIADAPWEAVLPADPATALYLVCTHGRHDACCAIFGRALARAFARIRSDQTWECSHLGGDRFAANLVVLPYGLYYGFVNGVDAEYIVEATEREEVDARLLRGRSTDDHVVQAARIHTQHQLGLSHLNALHHESTAAEGKGHWLVIFSTTEHAYAVQVRRHRLPDARASCAQLEPVSMREFEVVGFRRTDRPTAR